MIAGKFNIWRANEEDAFLDADALIEVTDLAEEDGIKWIELRADVKGKSYYMRMRLADLRREIREFGK